jgi:hypothetical protein
VRPSSVVYWSRFFIAVATGVGSVFMIKDVASGDMAIFAYVGVAVLVYALTAGFYRYVLRYSEVQLKTKNRYITLGIGTFIFAFIAAMIAAYTALGLH